MSSEDDEVGDEEDDEGVEERDGIRTYLNNVDRHARSSVSASGSIFWRRSGVSWARRVLYIGNTVERRSCMKAFSNLIEFRH